MYNLIICKFSGFRHKCHVTQRVEEERFFCSHEKHSTLSKAVSTPPQRSHCSRGVGYQSLVCVGRHGCSTLVDIFCDLPVRDGHAEIEGFFFLRVGILGEQFLAKEIFHQFALSEKGYCLGERLRQDVYTL